jgi:glycosyltransferase involved in cell wall biosynthesis
MNIRSKPALLEDAIVIEPSLPIHPNRGRNLRVAAFTSGAEVPGARFRVRQYIPALAKLGIAVDEHWPGLGAFPPAARWLRPAWLAGTLAQRLPQLAQAAHADVTWLYREMVSTLVTFEGLTRRPRILDIDDAVHLNRDGRTARRLAGLVDHVIVANAYLAEAWQKWTPAVEILPMSIDTNFYTSASLPEKPVIGWLGSRGNMPYLERIAPALAEIVRLFPNVTIGVCSEARPQLSGVPFVHVPWSAARERSFLASLTVGIVPLDDTPWERGKFSYKMLQYMASGRPSVLSPVGVNAEMLAQADIGIAASTHEQWVAALSTLIADPAAANQLGATARRHAVSDYSVEAIAPRLAALFRRFA